MKVGQENVNNVRAWSDPDASLNTFNMSTEGAGIQMDPDHQADGATMTEFSQVISSIAANG